MMNYIWTSLIIFSFISAVFTNNMQELSSSVISAGIDAVNLCIKLLGMLCLWSGLMNVAEKSGLTNLVGKFLSPILRRIFRESKDKPSIINAISMNLTANILGLGNAATPLGIEAMRRMKHEIKNSDRASDDMIKFVILNTAALRIIPTTVAVIRQSYGAENPMDIMPASWLASAGALIVGLALAEIMQLRVKRNKNHKKQKREKNKIRYKERQ